MILVVVEAMHLQFLDFFITMISKRCMAAI